MSKYVEKLRNIIRLLTDEEIKKLLHYVTIEAMKRGVYKENERKTI